MNYLIFALIFMSHVLAVWPLLQRLCRGRIPNSVDFACLSLMMYYDLGLGLELAGLPYEVPFFTPFFESSEPAQVMAVIILMAAPWVLRLGSLYSGRGVQPQPQEPVSSILPHKKAAFYLVALVVSLALTMYGLSRLNLGGAIYAARNEASEDFGPFIIIFYLATSFLAFYVRQSNSKRIGGLLFCIWLAVANAIATVMIGQRSAILIPFLMIALFRFRLNMVRLVALGTAGAVLAAGMLMVFKWQYAEKDMNLGQLVAVSLQTDFSRAEVLTSTLEKTELIGTRIMPYPLAGYVYSALYFVPRQVTPFKGYSTAMYFTGDICNSDPESLKWGFGVGAIEEALLNAGLLMALPMLFLYGVVLGFLDKLSCRVPSSTAATRLAGLWLFGYHLPALILNFGTMFIITWLLHALFVGRKFRLSSPDLVPIENTGTLRLELKEI